MASNKHATIAELICLKKLAGLTLIDGVYKLPFRNGYKWAFKLNKTDIILSRTKKQAQCQFVKFCAMDIKERKKAFYKLSDKERDFI